MHCKHNLLRRVYLWPSVLAGVAVVLGGGWRVASYIFPLSLPLSLAWSFNPLNPFAFFTIPLSHKFSLNAFLLSHKFSLDSLSFFHTFSLSLLSRTLIYNAVHIFSTFFSCIFPVPSFPLCFHPSLFYQRMHVLPILLSSIHFLSSFPSYTLTAAVAVGFDLLLLQLPRSFFLFFSILYTCFVLSLFFLSTISLSLSLFF